VRVSYRDALIFTTPRSQDICALCNQALPDREDIGLITVSS
jgi:hypothetical protein